MKQPARLAVVVLALAVAVAAGESAHPLVTGLKTPRAVVVGVEGKVFVVVAGASGTGGHGAVVRIDQGKAMPFAAGMDDPRGIAVYQQWLFVTERQRVWRIDAQGKAQVLVAATAFPSPPPPLAAITADPESGTLYVGGSDGKGKGAIYRISPAGKVGLLVDTAKWPGLQAPTALALDGQSHLLVADAGSGELHRFKIADGSTEKLAEGFREPTGLAWDWFGRLYIADGGDDAVFVIGRPGQKRVRLATGFKAPSGLCLDPTGKHMLVADREAGTLSSVPATVPNAPLDETPMPLETAVAFPDLRWAGWERESATGKIVPLRPLVLTHAGDGSNRVFVATQQGVIHVFPNDQKAKQTKVFLDIQERVFYNDNENEQGFLGLAYHPNFKKNGEFFVFYTPKKAKNTNLVCRYRVRADDPDRADPASEEVLLRVERPFWNHDGGTLCFGPDGYLYIALGDGGAANDPFDNGQNLKTLLGKVLRIDVDHHDANKPYAIPKDNPFAGRPDARPEIWAYGLRNVWRMAFDRQTGQLWAADVGQNLYEEIDLLKAGGNYGWNRREGLHPFGAKGVGPRPEMIEPIWEYHHDVGKSLTGGHVYRGRLLPELGGSYLYGDYVTAKIWALQYDETARRVVANRPIRSPGVPIMSFGEDEHGEVYFMTYSDSGRGLYRFVKKSLRPAPLGRATDLSR
jgi:glucose/arabinose dehydrogenase